MRKYLKSLSTVPLHLMWTSVWWSRLCNMKILPCLCACLKTPRDSNPSVKPEYMDSEWGRWQMCAKTSDIAGHTLLEISNYLTTTTIHNLTYALSAEPYINYKGLSAVVWPALLYMFDAVLLTVVAWQCFHPLWPASKETELIVCYHKHIRSPRFKSYGMRFHLLHNCFCLVLITKEWKYFFSTTKWNFSDVSKVLNYLCDFIFLHIRKNSTVKDLWYSIAILDLFGSTVPSVPATKSYLALNELCWDDY
jgi:hypothetical protein